MGKGRSFRRLAFAIGALGAGPSLACRTGPEPASLQTPQVVAATEGPSLAAGHRFGRWLQVAIEPFARATLEQACLLEQTGESVRAIELLGDAIESGPVCAALYLARGALYVATGYPRAAAGDFQQAVALEPDGARGWYALGHAYELLGLSRQALESLEHCTNLGIEEGGPHLSLARVYRSFGRLGQAARHYELALDSFDRPATELLIEAAVLTTEDSTKAAGVEALRERLESCRGETLSDDAWLLRALLREIRGEPVTNVASTLRALEVGVQELAALARNLLLAQQLADPETSAPTLARLLANETDEGRRSALERCLSRP